LVSYGKVKAVVSIFDAGDIEGFLGAEINDQQGLNILVGQHSHGIHGPVVMDGEETIAVSRRVPDIGSCLGTGGGLGY